MKVKYCFLIVCLMLLSGCSIDYHLDIDKNLYFDESVVMNASSDADISAIMSYNEFLPIDREADDPFVFKNKIDGIKYYKMEKSKDNSKMRFSYKFDDQLFNKSLIVNSCYKYITSMKVDNNLILSTSREFLGFDVYDNLDEVKVTLSSTYKLNETNADEVEGHNYIWYITRENANNKYLYLSLDTSVRNLTLWEKILEGEYTNIFTVSVLLFIVGMGIYWFFKKKSERRDKI